MLLNVPAVCGLAWVCCSLGPSWLQRFCVCCMNHTQWCVFSRQPGIYHWGLCLSSNPLPHPRLLWLFLSSFTIISSWSQTHSSAPWVSSYTLTVDGVWRLQPLTDHSAFNSGPDLSRNDIAVDFDIQCGRDISGPYEKHSEPSSLVILLLSRGCGDCGLSRRCMKEPWYVPVQSP